MGSRPSCSRTSVFVGVNMIEGQAADRGRPLGVEQNEQPGDAVLGFGSVVVQQSAGVLPAGLAVDDAVRAIPSGGSEIETGQLMPFGPADEVPGLAATGSV